MITKITIISRPNKVTPVLVQLMFHKSPSDVKKMTGLS